MGHDARVVANEILRRGWPAGAELTQLDIHKIMYFLHGHCLTELGEPLVNTEFAAWDHGPVQPTVYDSFKRFGDEPITELAQGFDPIKRTFRELPYIGDVPTSGIIERHMPRYLAMPTFEMVDMTHRPGTPWSLTRERALKSANIGMRISDDLIREAFEGAVNA